MLARLVAVLGDLDAAGLAAAADLHLRLDDARVADLVGGGDGLVDGGRGPARRARARRGGRTAACPGTRAGPSAAGHASRAGDSRSAAPWHNAAPHGAPQERHLRHLRRLRHPDRLGDRRLRRVRARRPSATASRSTRDELIPLFHEIQQRDRGAAPTSSTPRCCAARRCRSPSELGWPLEPSRSGFLPDSVQRWPPFKETNPQLEKLAKKYKIGLISNIDDKLLGPDAPAHSASTSTSSSPPSRCAPTSPTRRTSRSASAGSAARRAGSTSPSSYYHDVEPCLKAQDPGDLGQPHARRSSRPARRSRPPRSRPCARRPSCSARSRRGRAGASALHADVVVVDVSRVWQTTCTLVARAATRRS